MNMNIDLTQDETIIILDALGNRIEDLQASSMFGDADEIEDEIETLNTLMDKVGNRLDHCNSFRTATGEW
jgi:tetrahydromethanopterin S-methyltransferase subunit B